MHPYGPSFSQPIGRLPPLTAHLSILPAVPPIAALWIDGIARRAIPTVPRIRNPHLVPAFLGARSGALAAVQPTSPVRHRGRAAGLGCSPAPSTAPRTAPIRAKASALACLDELGYRLPGLRHFGTGHAARQAWDTVVAQLWRITSIGLGPWAPIGYS